MVFRILLSIFLIIPIVGCTETDELDSAFSEAMMRASEDQVVTEMASFAHDDKFRGQLGLVQNPLDLLATATEFWETQAPCSTLDIIDDALVLDFGDLEDDCTFNDHTYAGVTTIRIQTEGDVVTVDFYNEGLTNGVVTIDGSVQRVITGDQHSVTADLTTVRDISECEGRGWSHRGRGQGRGHGGGEYDVPEDGLVTIDLSAQFDYSPLDEELGYQSGFVAGGQSTRTTMRGDRVSHIDSLEVVYGEMVPQAGQRVMNTPRGNTVTLTFSRIDESTVGVHVEGPRGERDFQVDPVTGELL